jgi:protein TonB
MTTSLHAFMPYGAPDLIEARSRHLARALILGSALVVLMLVAVGAALRLLPAEAPPVVPIVVVDPHRVENIVEQPREPLPPPRDPPVVQDPLAAPVPVPDQLLVPPPPVAESPGQGATTGEGQAGGATGDGSGSGGADGPGHEILPRFDEVVYVEELPAALVPIKPAYPELAREARVEGRVQVRVLVGREGNVLDARVEKGLSIPLLDGAALEAARRWRFSPGRTNGHPVACWVSIPFQFSLR